MEKSDMALREHLEPAGPVDSSNKSQSTFSYGPGCS